MRRWWRHREDAIHDPVPLPENVIPFPRPPLPEGTGPWDLTEHLEMRECDGNVHVYLEIPGRCQCGTHSWDGTVPQV